VELQATRPVFDAIDDVLIKDGHADVRVQNADE
jgi:hypothetical protein